MSNKLTAQVIVPGDPSVGIPNTYITIDLPDAKTMFEDLPESRELLRHDLSEVFGKLYDGHAQVVFSDEEESKWL
jgi:hypothetical protein